MKIPELLAPAGNFEKLKTAIHYGADAVYMGGKKLSLRAHAANFSNAGIEEAIAYAHDRGVKVYVTVNILAHNRDLAGIEDYLHTLKRAGADGLIISDPGILAIAGDEVPQIPIHLSTQANVTNLAAARFWQKQGVKRVNLARELSLAELIQIRESINIEMEVFVHGALCISYSGRCMLSHYLTGRSANKGDCAHPCRYNYVLEEEKRPGSFFPVEEDGRGTYIFNSKDLCLLNQLPRLVDAGMDSLKIEGRMKSVYYVGAVVRVYRAALDSLAEQDNLSNFIMPGKFMDELLKLGSRGYTENFFSSVPGAAEMLYEGASVPQKYMPIGIVVEPGDRGVIEVRNPIRPNDLFDYLMPGIESSSHRIISITNDKGETLEQANPGNIVTLHTSPAPVNWLKNGLLRKSV